MIQSSTSLMNNPVFDTSGFMNGDVNFDGATNATDAKMIAQYVAGLRDLPTPPDQTQKLLFYHSDHLGGSNIITDGSGNLVQHVQYSPYGEIDYELNLGVSVNYLFTGQEFDREAGLYYYSARYYDPEIGRFIQPDTIIPDPSDNQAYNRYSYCRNNPIMLTDPSGHEPSPDDVRREQYWLINQHTAADRLGENAAAQRLEIYDQFDHFMLPALAGMKDDDAVRVNMFYEWAMSGGAVSEGLQNEMTAQGVDSPDALWSYYVNDTVEDEAGDWTEYAGIGMAAVILGIASAGIGTAASAGMGLTTSTTIGAVTTTSLSFAGSLVAGGIAGGISGGAMAAATGQNIAKGMIAGVAIGVVTAGIAHAMFGGKILNRSVDGLPEVSNGKGIRYGKVDMNLSRPEDALLEEYTLSLTVDDVDTYTILCHGNKFFITGADGSQIGPSKLAQMISNDPSFIRSKDVALLSCNTGGYNNGFAQKLAQIINKPVKAPNAYLYGDYTVYPKGFVAGISSGVTMGKWLSRPGKFVSFSP